MGASNVNSLAGGYSPLALAMSKEGTEDAMRALLDCGVNLELETTGRTILHDIVAREENHMVVALVNTILER